jgi:hypothetical protein
MLLFVKKGCPFCKELEEMELPKDVRLFPMVETPKGLKVEVGDLLLDPPTDIEGFPLLVDGPHRWVGREVVLEKLKEL